MNKSFFCKDFRMTTLSLKMEGENYSKNDAKNNVFPRVSTFLVQRQNEGPYVQHCQFQLKLNFEET